MIPGQGRGLLSLLFRLFHKGLRHISEKVLRRGNKDRSEYPESSIGRHEHVGYITVGMGSLKPGLGVRKNLGAVGDVFITGIVGSGGAWEPLLLQNTRLSVVMELADCIFEGICACEFGAV